MFVKLSHFTVRFGKCWNWIQLQVIQSFGLIASIHVSISGFRFIDEHSSWKYCRFHGKLWEHDHCGILLRKVISRIICLPVRAKPNQEMRSTFFLCQKKTKWRMDLPEGFVCPIPPSKGPIIAGRSWAEDGSFQVVWRTDLEVDLEGTQNYCVELLALYPHRVII